MYFQLPFSRMFLSELYKIEISPSKLTDYLFNFSHPDGWSKAKYFQEHEIGSIGELEKLLLMVVLENKVTKEWKPPLD
jgi:hypothetical protein